MSDLGVRVRVRHPVNEITTGDRIRGPLDVAQRAQPETDQHQADDEGRQERDRGDEDLQADETANRVRDVTDGIGDHEVVAVVEG